MWCKIQTKSIGTNKNRHKSHKCVTEVKTKSKTSQFKWIDKVKENKKPA